MERGRCKAYASGFTGGQTCLQRGGSQQQGSWPGREGREGRDLPTILNLFLSPTRALQTESSGLVYIIERGRITTPTTLTTGPPVPLKNSGPGRHRPSQRSDPARAEMNGPSRDRRRLTADLAHVTGTRVLANDQSTNAQDDNKLSHTSRLNRNAISTRAVRQPYWRATGLASPPAIEQ